jgi:hypothetical protein
VATRTGRARTKSRNEEAEKASHQRHAQAEELERLARRYWAEDAASVEERVEEARAEGVWARAALLQAEKNRTVRIDPPQSTWGGLTSDDVRLLGSLPYLIDLHTRHRGRVAVP